MIGLGKTYSGFVQVMENLESHEISEFHFQAWKVMEFNCRSLKVMEKFLKFCLKDYLLQKTTEGQCKIDRSN